MTKRDILAKFAVDTSNALFTVVKQYNEEHPELADDINQIFTQMVSEGCKQTDKICNPKVTPLNKRR